MVSPYATEDELIAFVDSGLFGVVLFAFFVSFAMVQSWLITMLGHRNRTRWRVYQERDTFHKLLLIYLIPIVLWFGLVLSTGELQFCDGMFFVTGTGCGHFGPFMPESMHGGAAVVFIVSVLMLAATAFWFTGHLIRIVVGGTKSPAPRHRASS